MAKTETVKHTPGPLRLGLPEDFPNSDNPTYDAERSILAPKDPDLLPSSPPAESIIAWVECGGSLEADVANARRLVACWNACQRFSTEALEAGAVPELYRILADVASRIRKPLDRGTWYLSGDPLTIQPLLDAARAAIAKATKH